jgi:hypothetical protein
MSTQSQDPTSPLLYQRCRGLWRNLLPMLHVADSPACSTTYTTQPSSDFDTMSPSLTFMLTPIATGPLAPLHVAVSRVSLYSSREHQWHGYLADNRSLPPPPWKQNTHCTLLRCPRNYLVPCIANWTRLGHSNHDSYRQYKRTVTGL